MTGLKKYASFIKIEHTLFSIPLLFAGALLAQQGWPSLKLTFLILVAGAGARVVAMGFNRIIDREFDRLNPRTSERHLASGKMNLVEAWATVIVSLAIYLFAAWLISDFCLIWSWIPIVAFGAYPYFKRFTRWAHVGLGLVWSLVPMGGFLAMKGNWDGFESVLLLGVFCLFWLAGFDIIYATMDEEFDRSAGLFSLPAVWGKKNALRIAALFHFLAFVSLVLLYGIWFSGPITVMLLIIAGICLFLEQKYSTSVDFAFFKMNAIIGFVVLFFVLSGSKGF